MIFALFGPPGSGKGTQAKSLIQALKVPQLATGDMLRESIAQNSDLGRKAKEFMNKGQLVPDSLIVDLIKERVTKTDCVDGFMLDGFPRTVPQAEALDGLLNGMKKKLMHVVSFKVDNAELVERLAGRMVCSSCGASYHVRSKPTKKDRVCDFCSGPVVKRDDDKAEVVLKRLDTFLAQTAPVEDYYRNKAVLREINATGSETEIFNRIMSVLGKKTC